MSMNLDEIKRATRIVYEEVKRNPRYSDSLLNPFSHVDGKREAISAILRRAIQSGQLAIAQGEIDRLISYIAGLGELDKLTRDPSVSSIQVMDFDRVLVERSGVWEETNIRWRTPDELRSFASALAARAGQNLTPDHPVVEATFTDPVGRMQIDTTATNRAGVTLHFRLGRSEPIYLEQMVASGMLTQEMADFLIDVASHPAGVLIVGLPGVGKTTFLEALIRKWPPRPFVTLDDQSEFQVDHPYASTFSVSQRSEGGFTLEDALIAALRKNVQRVAVAEVRGGEAATLLHYGTTVTPWTTIHASARTAALRLLTLVKGADGSPYQRMEDKAILRNIATVFPIVVEIGKSSIGGVAIFRVNMIGLMQEDGSIAPLWKAIYNEDGLFQGFRRGEEKLFRSFYESYHRTNWGRGIIPKSRALYSLVNQELEAWEESGGRRGLSPTAALSLVTALMKIRKGDPTLEAKLSELRRYDEIAQRIEWLGKAMDYVAGLVKAREWMGVAELINEIKRDPAYVYVADNLKVVMPANLVGLVRDLSSIRESIQAIDRRLRFVPVWAEYTRPDNGQRERRVLLLLQSPNTERLFTQSAHSPQPQATGRTINAHTDDADNDDIQDKGFWRYDHDLPRYTLNELKTHGVQAARVERLSQEQRSYLKSVALVIVGLYLYIQKRRQAYPDAVIGRVSAYYRLLTELLKAEGQDRRFKPDAQEEGSGTSETGETGRTE